MNIVKIIVTVFDALLLFVFGWVGATADDRQTLNTTVFLGTIILLNLLCIWG